MESKRFSVYLLFILFGFVSVQCLETYRAAVFEISPVVHETLEDTIESNLRIYEEQIAEAALQGVQIIAFPEYGLTSMPEFSDYRNTAKSIVPEIKDPRTNPWNPCNEPGKFQNSEVLRRISCSAKENSIFVLINILTQRPCNISEESQCRSDGTFLHNSNIVFESNGSVIALYHKTHLFLEEEALDPSINGEPIVFDAGFAKFGTFICWDIGYSHPSVEYVRDLGIRNIVYSTAWGGELPFLTSLQLFNAWARGMEVNLVASNLYLPYTGRLGSGIFSSNLGALNYTFDLSTPNRLIIADIPLIPGEGSAASEGDIFSVPNFNKSLEKTLHYEFTDFPTSQPTNESLRVWYDLTIYDHVFLDSASGNMSVCQGNVCCELEYAYAEANATYAKHALLVKDGTRSFAQGKYLWNIQVCAVVRCESTENSSSCGQVPRDPEATVPFSYLKLKAKLKADLLFPHIIAPNLRLPPVSYYDYSVTRTSLPDDDTQIDSEGVLTLQKEAPLSVFAVYGKFYINNDV